MLTGVFDTRVAILAVLVIIVAGTILLRWVDVEEGQSIATHEDLTLQPAAPRDEAETSAITGVVACICSRMDTPTDVAYDPLTESA